MNGKSWLNRTVLGIALASLFSDWSHEMATAILPTFLGSLGATAAWLGIIEGVSDGLASFAKLGSGFYTDGLSRRKPIAFVGYLVTTLATAAFGLATAPWHVLIARAAAWLGRGVRTPVRKALLAAAVDRSQVAVEETLEDSFCAELVEPVQHGMAFGVLATVNGVGDFLSSAVVGLLWSAFGTTVAFGYSAVLFLMSAVLVIRLGSMSR
jgi:MFS family permease